MDDVWTQGTTIAAKNSGALRAHVAKPLPPMDAHPDCRECQTAWAERFLHRRFDVDAPNAQAVPT